MDFEFDYSCGLVALDDEILP